VLIFQAISFFSSITSIFAGSIVYFHSNKKPVHRLFFILCLFNAYWGFTEFFYRQAQSAEGALFWIKIFVFVILVIPVGLHFTMLYIDKASFLLNKRVLFAIYFITALIPVYLVFFHHTFFSITKMPWGYSFLLPPKSILRNTAILWLVIINSCSVFLILSHLARCHEHIKRKQVFLVALGVIVPIVFANVSQFLLPVLKVQIPELTTVGTTLQSVFIGFAIWRYDLFELNPATAADNIVSTMPDMLILSDPEGKIAATNRAATDLLGYEENDLIQKPVSAVLSGGFSGPSFFAAELETNEHPETQIPMGKTLSKNFEDRLIANNSKEIPASVSVSILRNRDLAIAGYVIIARDITEQKKNESEREALIAQLKAALSNIKVLRGLLPICAGCKKIRDNDGYWQQVEHYISAHTNADFTHALCDDCTKELYPEIFFENTLN
jgi:PAS domain S-box-containing protein